MIDATAIGERSQVAAHPAGFSTIYRSSAPRARWATVALALIGLVLAVSLYHFLDGFGVVELARQGKLTTAIAARFDATTATLSSTYLLLLFASGVTFLAWLSRAVDNVPALGGGRPRVTPRWAIGWWFVPYVNLVVPYNIVKDLNHRMTTPGTREGGRTILAWWLLWIGTGVASLPALGVKVHDASSLSTWLGLSMFGHIVSLGAAILAIVVVRQIQRRATALAAARPSVTNPGVEPAAWMGPSPEAVDADASGAASE
jgi:hypothetical protein